MEFKKSANFLMIVQKNKSMTKLVPGKIVSSKNSPDHGFGISNINRAVKKYGGEYHLNCIEEAGLFLAETEIMLPLKE